MLLSYLLVLKVSKLLSQECSVHNKFMSAFFYANLNKHNTVHQDCACASINLCRQLVHAFINIFSLLATIVLLFRWFFSNCHFCLPMLSWMSFSCFWLSILLAFTLISVIFMLYFLSHVLLSLSFAYRKCRLHFSIPITYVVFWHGKCLLSCTLEFLFVSKGKFGVYESF